jgi:hypothetical protein
MKWSYPANVSQISTSPGANHKRAWSGLISDERFNAILQRVETNREEELLSEPSAMAATS